MISWTRLTLGQAQKAAEQATALADDAVVSWPDEIGSMPTAVTQAPAGSVFGQRAPRLIGFMAIAGAFVAVTFLLITQGQRAQRLEQQLAAAQDEVSRLQEQNQQLTQQFSSFQAERHALDQRVFSLIVQLSSAAAELQQTNERLAATQALARELSQAKEQRETELAHVTSERDAARRDAENFKQGQADLNRSVTRLRQRFALLDREYRGLSAQFAPPKNVGGEQAGDDAAPAEPHELTPAAPSAPHAAAARPADLPAPQMLRSASQSEAERLGPAGIELPPVLVGEPLHPAPWGGVYGRLVNVNEQQRFVIIDKGSEDGVRNGMVFDIVQQGILVGRATAVRVHPKLAACNLLSDGRTTPLLTGDPVVQHDLNHQ